MECEVEKLRFAVPVVQQRPEIYRMLLQLIMSPYLIRTPPASHAEFMEKEVIRLAWRLGRWIRPKDLTDHFQVDFRTARNWLRTLVKKGWLKPIERGSDVRYYELVERSVEMLL